MNNRNRVLVSVAGVLMAAALGWWCFIGNADAPQVIAAVFGHASVSTCDVRKEFAGPIQISQLFSEQQKGGVKRSSTDCQSSPDLAQVDVVPLNRVYKQPINFELTDGFKKDFILDAEGSFTPADIHVYKILVEKELSAADFTNLLGPNNALTLTQLYAFIGQTRPSNPALGHMNSYSIAYYALVLNKLGVPEMLRLIHKDSLGDYSPEKWELSIPENQTTDLCYEYPETCHETNFVAVK